MLIFGIDPSLTATGTCFTIDGQKDISGTMSNHPKLGTIERVAIILTHIEENLNLFMEQPDLIVIEGFSYGSKGRSVFDTAYLGWRIREYLEDLRKYEDVPWLEVPPTSLKKFTTGLGNSAKEIMIQQVYRRWGVEFKDNNQCDAFALCKVGEEYLKAKNGTSQALPAFQMEVIATLIDGPKPKKKAKKVKD